MGFYIQDDYWESISAKPKKVQQEVLWGLAHLYFTGEEPEIANDDARSLFVMARGRVTSARTKAEQKRNQRADKSATHDTTNVETHVETNVETHDATKVRHSFLESESKSNRESNNPLEPETEESCNSSKPESVIARFRAPTPAEVAEYATGKGLSIDAERFCDFYESKGWKVGKSPMKNWEAAVRNWCRDNKNGDTRNDQPVNLGQWCGAF